VSPVSFLLIALVIAIIGTLVVVVANRSPRRYDSAMAEFQREMRALAPRPPAGTPAARRTPSSGVETLATPPETDDPSAES
jgi:hypothetical protein